MKGFHYALHTIFVHDHSRGSVQPGQSHHSQTPQTDHLMVAIRHETVLELIT